MAKNDTALTRAINAIAAAGGRIVKVSKNTVSALLPAGGSSKVLRNPGTKLKNIQVGYYDESGYFRPVRASYDYDPVRGGDYGALNRTELKELRSGYPPLDPEYVLEQRGVRAKKETRAAAYQRRKAKAAAPAAPKRKPAKKATAKRASTTRRRTVKKKVGRVRNSGKKAYEIVDLGVDYPDYFQGFGTAFSRFNNAVYGIGHTAQEAYDDAVEQVYHIDDAASVLRLPKRPGFSGRVLKSDGENAYYHVGIRWND